MSIRRGNSIIASNKEVNVEDVKVNGTSVVENKIANIDLTGKQDVISDLATIRSGATAGSTAIQPDDNISELTNDANYQTNTQVNSAISTHNTDTSAHSDIRNKLSDKQNILTAGSNISIEQGQEIVVPTGYTQLEYILSDTNTYIKTGINDGNDNLSYEVKFQGIGGSGYRYILGCWSSDGDKNTVLYVASGSNNLLGWVNKAYSSDASARIDSDAIYTVYADKNVFNVGGATYTSFATGTSRTGDEIYLFRRNGTKGSAAQTTSIITKLYYCRFKDGDSLVRNFIPAKRNSDNVVGLYDTVSETFFTNDGTSNFTAGPIASTQTIISATDTKYTAGNGLTLTGTTFSANVIDNTSSDSTINALSARVGKVLQEQINNLNARGKYLSVWNCTTGLAMDEPPVDPYTYETGSYFIVGVVGTGTNYRPSGSTYSSSSPSRVVETETVKPNDTYFYDGTTWRLLKTPEVTVSFANLAGNPEDNTNLKNALDAKTDDSSLATVAKSGSYSDLTDTPAIPTKTSDLTNDSSFQNATQVNTSISTHNSSSSAHSDIRSAIASKSTVSVSATGTSTDEVQYITIDGVQKKLAGGSGSEEDNLTITKNSSNKIQTVGMINKNETDGNVVYDWVGTLDEYETQNIGTLHPTWICYIVDDTSGGISVYTKAQVNNLLINKANVGASYTKSESDGLLENKANVGSSYTKSESDDLLENKANVGTSYTKTESDELLENKANVGTSYTKSESDGLLGEKADNSSVLHTTGNETATGTKTLVLGNSTATTQTTSDNSTKVATTAYVNNKFQIVSALPANPDPNVWYAILEG